MRIDYICQFYVYAQESNLYKRHFLSETSFPARKISCCQGIVRVSQSVKHHLDPKPVARKGHAGQRSKFSSKEKITYIHEKTKRKELISTTSMTSRFENTCYQWRMMNQSLLFVSHWEESCLNWPFICTILFPRYSVDNTLRNICWPSKTIYKRYQWQNLFWFYQ